MGRERTGGAGENCAYVDSGDRRIGYYQYTEIYTTLPPRCLAAASTETIQYRRSCLMPIHTARPDATKQFCCVASGSINWP